MILVTGAGGTVGSEVLRQLQSTGAKVRAGFHVDGFRGTGRAAARPYATSLSS